MSGIKIDCNILKNYINERKRMCKTYSCSECGFNAHRKLGDTCEDLVFRLPKECVEIVQAFSDANPRQTLFDKFQKLFPNAKLRPDGYPLPCPRYLGWEEHECAVDCGVCWNVVATDENSPVMSLEGLK